MYYLVFDIKNGLYSYSYFLFRSKFKMYGLVHQSNSSSVKAMELALELLL